MSASTRVYFQVQDIIFLLEMLHNADPETWTDGDRVLMSLGTRLPTRSRVSQISALVMALTSGQELQHILLNHLLSLPHLERPF
jgi:hypothetical protein